MRHSAHLRLYKGIPASPSKAQLNAEGTALAESASEPGGPLQLLIIEENARFAVTLRTTLETEGFVVAVAATVSQARQRMLDAPPAFVIIDTMAPSHDSYELLRTLRASGNDVPVIVLTTHGDEQDKLRGFWLGADDCIAKPVNPLELVARIRVLLRRAHPALAYRFDTPDGAIVFSGDTTVNDDLIALAQNADILVHQVADLEYLEHHGLIGPGLRRMRALQTDVTEVGEVAERAHVGEFALAQPYDPRLLL